MTEPLPAHLLDALRARAGERDVTGAWPAEELSELAVHGATARAVPREFGGAGASALELHQGYEQIARHNLNLALILSQQDSAVDFLSLAAAAAPSPARSVVLRDVALGTRFITIGIAQLTTSRQRGAPALRATRDGNGYRLNGVVPWATGAAVADDIVVGAVLDDARQVLVQLPVNTTAGVSVDPPLPLVALRASCTGPLRCENAWIDDTFVLREPEEKVLGCRTKSLPLGQTFLASGLCLGALDLISALPSSAAQRAAATLGAQLEEVRQEVQALCAPGREKDATAAAPRLRGACNDLAVRITHAAVALYKGSALIVPHPAERCAREAMFLLVWSCPDPVIDCTVEMLGGEGKMQNAEC